MHFQLTTVDYTTLCKNLSVLSVSIIMLAGCASTYSTVGPVSSRSTYPPADSDHLSDSLSLSPGTAHLDGSAGVDHLSVTVQRERLLREKAQTWMGTPHRWGGTTSAGIDCSAFVQTMYSDAFLIELPRTTKDQSREGKRVSLSEIETGDLLFYKINPWTRHVGIYLGGNEFVHSSKSEGVVISPLDAPYWSKRFWMARRLLSPENEGDKGLPGNRNASKRRISW